MECSNRIATLDHLCNGRVILGVGLGDFQEKENKKFSEIADKRLCGEMLDEGLEIISGLQSGEYRDSGDYYQIRNTLFIPKPVQKPRIPI